MEGKGSHGHIVNINSMSGLRVTPSAVTHFYSASKYALAAMTEVGSAPQQRESLCCFPTHSDAIQGVRQELRAKNSRIRVTVCIISVSYIDVNC